MRVLTFTSLFPNTVQPLLGVFVYQRVAHLARRPGNSVEVVAPVPYFPRWLRWTRWRAKGQIPRQEQIGELMVHHPRYLLLPKVSMPLHGLLIFLGCFPCLRRLQESLGFECIDAHYIYPDGFAAVLLGKVLGVPVVVSARGSDINLFPSFRLIRPMICWTLRQAAGIVAVSRALRDTMVRLGAPPEKTQVISNGVDLERFSPMDGRVARSQLGLPESGCVIVSVGALVPVKGHRRLISAFAEIAPRYPETRLYIVGEGVLRTKLENQVREMGLQQRVFLVGSRPNEELKLWYNAADLTCLLSSREGLPNVLLESLACGTPVVATRVGGIPEVISSPELGLLVEPDTRAIAVGLESALQKQWDREALVCHARSRTWAVVAAEVEQFLASCREGSQRKPAARAAANESRTAEREPPASEGRP